MDEQELQQLLESTHSLQIGHYHRIGDNWYKIWKSSIIYRNQEHKMYSTSMHAWDTTQWRWQRYCTFINKLPVVLTPEQLSELMLLRLTGQLHG